MSSGGGIGDGPIDAPGLDVTSFALDDDSPKLAMVSSQPVLLP